jgi:hypothetical protein
MKIGFNFPSGKFTWNALVSLKSPTEPLEAPFPELQTELQTEGLVFLDVFKPVEQEKNVLGHDRNDAAFHDLVLVNHFLKS